MSFETFTPAANHDEGVSEAAEAAQRALEQPTVDNLVDASKEGIEYAEAAEKVEDLVDKRIMPNYDAAWRDVDPSGVIRRNYENAKQLYYNEISLVNSDAIFDAEELLAFAEAAKITDRISRERAEAKIRIKRIDRNNRNVR